MSDSTISQGARIANASQEDLRRQGARSGAVTLAGNSLRFILAAAATILLARLLNPSDFGLIAMIMPILTLATMVGHFGLTSAVVHRPRLTQEETTATFWLNLLITTAAGAFIALLAVPMAEFYGKEELVLPTLALSITLPIAGISAQHMALLQRNMMISQIVLLDLFSVAIGSALAVSAAYSGAGYWALVISPMAQPFVKAILVWFCHGWRPDWRFAIAPALPLLRFGGQVVGFNVLNFVSRNADNVLIGYIWGDAALGFYSKAYSLLLLPAQQINTPLTQVIVPLLSRLTESPGNYRALFRRALAISATIGMPAVVFAAVAVEPLIVAVLGDHWRPAIPVFLALAPAAFLGAFSAAPGWIYLSWGHVGRRLAFGAISAIITLAGFIVALPYGIVVVALSFSLTQVLLRWPSILVCIHNTPMRQSDFFVPLLRPAAASLAAAVAPYFLQPNLDDLSPMMGLLSLAAIYAASLCLVWLILPGGLHEMRSNFALITHLRSQRRKPNVMREKPPAQHSIP